MHSERAHDPKRAPEAASSPTRTAFFKRSSTGFIPRRSAIMLICVSQAKVICGLPSPRMAPPKGLLV